MRSPQFDTLALSQIVSSLTNPRKTFNQAKLTELAESIKASGVHQPILVRPLPGSRVADTGRGVTHEIISGERRYRASQMAGAATIPAMIRDMPDDQVLEVQLVENLQRDDLTELEEAEGYQTLLAASAITIDALAAKISKSRSYVFGRLKLLDLCFEAQSSLRAGTIDFSRAVLLARIPDHKLQIDALKLLSEKNYQGDFNLGYRAAASYVQREFMLHLDRASFAITDAALVPEAGSCRQCAKRTGHNPDLFADVKSADVCTDPPCYHRKEEAHTAQTLANAHLSGKTVISGREAKALMPSEYGRIEGYLRLDTLQDSPTDKPLRKMLGKQLEASGVLTTLLQNPYKDGELIDMLPAATVAELLKATQHAEQGMRIDTQLQDSKKADAEKAKAQAKADYEQAWRTALLRRTWSAIAAAVTESQGADTVSTAVIRHVAMHYANACNSDRAKRVCELLDLGKIAPKAALCDFVQTTARPQDVLQLLIMQADVEYLPYLAEYHPNQAQNVGLMLIARDYHVDIDAVKADCKTATRAKLSKSAISAPGNAPAAQRVGGGAGDGAKPKLKRKTTAVEAQAQIAAALRESGSGADAQGIDGVIAQPVAGVAADASTPSLAVDALVVVRAEAEDTLPLTQRKWAGKRGTITQQVDGADRWMVSFRGRDGGLCAFDGADLQPVARALALSAARPVAYRGPCGETWSGRGLKPRWVLSQIEKGISLDDMRVVAA